MARPEKSIEDYLVERVEFCGGQAAKWDVRGHRGRVDRVVMLPCGEMARHWHVYLVELKAGGKKPRPEQLREHARLRALGFEVIVIDTKEQVDELTATYMDH